MVTVPAGLGGKYILTVQTTWPSSGSANADRRLTYRINGGTDVGSGLNAERYSVTSLTAQMEMTVTIDLAGGDYVEVRQWTGIGSTTTTAYSAQLSKLDSGKVGQGIGARAYNSATQTVTAGVETAMTFDSEEFDTDAFHSTSANTSRMTIPAGLGGKYLVRAHLGFPGSHGVIFGRLKKNGSTFITGSEDDLVSGTDSSLAPAAVVDLIAGDYLEVFASRASGTSVGAATSSFSNAFEIMRLDSGSQQQPGTELDYVQITSSVTVTGTSEGSPTTVITGTSRSYDGTTILIEFMSPRTEIAGAAGDALVVDLYEDSTILGRLHVRNTVVGSSVNHIDSAYGALRRTPSAGTHQYIVKAWKTTGSTVSIGAGAGGTGANVAAFLRITRV